MAERSAGRKGFHQGCRSRLPFLMLSVITSARNQADPQRPPPTVLAAEDGRKMAGKKHDGPSAANDRILSAGQYFCQKSSRSPTTAANRAGSRRWQKDGGQKT